MIMLRRILYVAVALLVAAAAAWALWPRPIPVDVAVIDRRAIDVTVEDEGVSRIREVYTVSAPISGRLLRLSLDPGDKVTADKTILATIEPAVPGLLDARARTVAVSNVAAAQSAVDQAKAQQAQAQAQLDFANGDLQRTEALSGRGVVPEQVYQKALLAVQVAQTALEAAKAGVAAREQELASAKAALIEGEPIASSTANDAAHTDCVTVKAPVSGEVLSVATTSEQVVASGTPLLTLGDPANLEVAVDLLSRDAVSVKPGDAAAIEDWGGPPLNATVERVDPAARTKVSALGIEEQRVTVVLKLADRASGGLRLGHDFRVVARITVWHGDNLLAVPMSALFRQGADWAAFVMRDGKAELRHLTLGHQNSSFGEVLSGLEAGETVILHPGDRVVDGGAVVVRS
jgi:HlyD family secretion protein